MQAEFEKAASESDDPEIAIPKPVLSRDRPAIIKMVESAFAAFNSDQLKLPVEDRCIRKTFAQAGQDPWAADTSAFEGHLDSLMQNPAYSQLTQEGQAKANQAAAERIEIAQLEAQLAVVQLNDSAGELND